MNWNDVIGQDDVKRRLVSMVQHNRLPHALMLCGPSGSGKMALGLAFASYLLCERHAEGDAPCGECASCAMMRRFEHPDLHFSYPVIRPAGTSSEHKMNSDDFAPQWREMLQKTLYPSMDLWLDQMDAANQQAQMGVGESDLLMKRLGMKSSQGGYKVAVVWLAERMNQECANKLLKLLEEPPAQTLFIMVCQEPELLLETIKSRTQRIDLAPIMVADMQQALIQKRNIMPEDARRVARLANGSWTNALAELSVDNENKQFLDMFIMLMRLAYQRNIRELRRWSDAVAAYGREKQKRMLTYFARLMRENFMFNFGIADLVYMSREEEDFARNFARFVNEQNIVEISELIDRCIRDISQNANAKVVFFDYAINMILYIKKA
ncbi:DNA polymerase III subunit delta [Hoylesella loescheii]|jgi:DNA polymerase III, gamma/tau subunit dnaX|uniref:DNA polymerase III subunit n=1 Tax=Hoylesella loescheii TaxID=840 RepID=UPI0028EAFD77|nr:DNA polymerase III subunit delta [Hoylesella loescheii]